MKNGYYDRKVRQPLETDMVVVKHGQDKVLSRDNVNFLKTNMCETSAQRNEKTTLKCDVILY